MDLGNNIILILDECRPKISEIKLKGERAQ